MKNIKGSILLLLTAIIWGTSFVSQKLGMNYVEPFTFGAARFILGAVVLLPLIFMFNTVNKKSNKEKNMVQFNRKDLLTGGTLCGCALFFGASLQQWGLVYTSAGKAGFITALYIVLVPIIGIFMKKRVDIYTWLGVLLAVIGLYLLSIKEGFFMEIGDAIILAGTLFWAIHILIVDSYAAKVESLKLSCVQFLTAGILSLLAAYIFENPDIEAIVDCAGPILYTAIMVVGVAYTLQIIGQRYTNPTVASLLMSLEAVFSAICGALFLKETMTSRELIGCILVFIAVILAQIKPRELIKIFSKSLDKANIN
ncbi:MAG: DMT family transporter [Tissierellia bacterium]|nr:DMT family transporter [Tissierellia bacterium]